MSTDPRRPVVATVTAMDEYQRRILDAAHEVLARNGIPLMVHVDGPSARGIGSSLLVSLLARAGGVITMNRPVEAEQRQIDDLLERLGLAVVYVGVESAKASAVRGDNDTGMRSLLGHLLDERGVRRLALVRGSHHQPDSIAREAIVRQELAARDLELDDDLVVTGEFRGEVAYPAVESLLARRRDVEAIVALNDPMAVAAVAAVVDAGLRVPEDVLVSGFDNDTVAGLWPGLTTVDQDLERQGETAAQLLLDQLAGARRRNVVVPSRLVRRGSTAGSHHPPAVASHSATEMARLGRDQLAVQAGTMALSQAFDECRTVEQTVGTLADHLPRLGVTRCFVALYQRADEAPEDHKQRPAIEMGRAELILDHRDGRQHVCPPGAFPSHRLLPDPLADELDGGLLVLQPLGVLDRPLGYVLFEQAQPATPRLAEVLRIHLTRAIDGVLTTEEHRTRAERLEQTVARATEQLRAEIRVRERAEEDLQRANAELRRSAMVDGLTQIANRGAFDEYLNEHWDRQAAEGGQLALIMADVDEFKAYNDHYGHVLGDEALRMVATCLDRAAREPQDLACRFGGEEFAVVLPHSGVEGAVAVARRFRELLAGFAIPHAASKVGATLTVSLGVATSRPAPGTHPNDVVAAADRALYRAKALGRDRIHVGAASHDIGHPEGGVTPAAAGTSPPTTSGEPTHEACS